MILQESKVSINKEMSHEKISKKLIGSVFENKIIGNSSLPKMIRLIAIEAFSFSKKNYCCSQFLREPAATAGWF